ncbi:MULTISPECIES: bifunctional 2-polyprenyl-6-hydroxyphenol methylase/3-demethylubiquinol 3-O-methyltransferase UbiG [unclassified Azospirillum]|uniref:bifunctional 2-polyprenyl-6-hydroxyphenol methylase/3-demethylubiquinol 3-O-methyltransferase UbiG n=1 Tax=unclassified Azospirillum TaxID=2630922 RepID=UPI000B752122|nr:MULTISPECIES: bifunctional 2-polyprenyl-6-hydroxyphenol methylase/3-demethylubiquinol 3-O-methyltransferase UbiG [unclassified Azospirillum]SNS58821.1 3-demethylubiquinone-9 3-methyltransferase [Azospirillum sp. RU38E]SNS78552.1 3-demethylubiquinone-9 3-methyltransferase [Azospirillum sp. RU37A]
MNAATARTTIDQGEIERFSRIAAEWWDPAGKFRPLHKFNPVRLAYIRDAICAAHGRDPKAPRPLDGIRIVDVGCGGGLLSEPLARLGASVTGVDAAEKNVKTAAAHAAETGVTVDYRATTAEALVDAGEQFDVVLAMEIVEHVADVDLFLEAVGKLAKPGGLVFMATLNRTAKGWLLGVVAAEYVLGWLPRGTHDWKKFLRPSELVGGLRRAGVAVRDISGVAYNPISDKFSLSPKDLGVNYLLWGVRE